MLLHNTLFKYNLSFFYHFITLFFYINVFQKHFYIIYLFFALQVFYFLCGKPVIYILEDFHFCRIMFVYKKVFKPNLSIIQLLSYFLKNSYIIKLVMNAYIFFIFVIKDFFIRSF